MKTDLAGLTKALQARGATSIYAKRLAENDNSKNQIYLAGSFEPLSVLPFHAPNVFLSNKGRQVVRAPVSLSWLLPDGSESPAPHSKLILYPQYPEVRLSGFLRGSKQAPADLLGASARIAGRVLLLGVRSDRSIIATVIATDSSAADEISADVPLSRSGVLARLPLLEHDSRVVLLATLRGIASKGWLSPVKRTRDGLVVPYEGRNAGGVTLEAMLGIAPNGRAEPDYHGWEVKQFAVRSLETLAALSPVTLFTPEPTEGVYALQGVEKFIRDYGYPDKHGKPDRLNVGSRFTVNKRSSLTGLTLRLSGVDDSAGKILNVNEGILLVDDGGVVAAKWPFVSLIEHWNRKHAQAVYVPALKREEPLGYRFHNEVFLAAGTDFGKFLRALAKGLVSYDPGIKMEGASTAKPKIHRRSQFRIAFGSLKHLYDSFDRVTL